MKLDFRQRLLSTTLLVGASMIASPVVAKGAAQPAAPTCPPGVAPGTNGCVEGATPATPVTTGPQAAVPPAAVGTNAQGAPAVGQQEIVVTGSRIPQPNLETASPVTTVTSQEVKLSGTSRTEDLVNSLPQVFAAQGSNVANGASGTATVDLRGLGSKRNLVLVNGKRLQAGDTGNPVADINFIPNQMVKRVDVLTGGASSVYGADAVAGVINFILDTTFTGFRIDGQAAVFQHNNSTNNAILAANAARGFLPPHGNVVNGGSQDIAGMFGAAFDDGRGHITAYATYRNQEPILESTRDYSFCTLASNADGSFSCGGSSTSANGTFRLYDPVTFTRLFLGQVQGTNFIPGSTPFNFAPYNYFQRPDERYNFGAFADYEIAPGAHPYLEAMFMDDHTDAQIAPSGDFGNTGIVACDNALLSAQERNILCTPKTVLVKGVPTTFNPVFTGPLNGAQNVPQTVTYIFRRNVEGGGRDDDVRHTDYRIVGGLRGDPLPGISYDAYWQTGRTLRSETYFNDFSVARLNQAIDAVAVLNGVEVAPGTPGATIECRAVLTGLNPNCVPYNVFAAGGVNPAALDFLQTPGFQRGTINENIAHIDATLTGDTYGLRTPWADTGIGLNVGAEYRKESLDFKVDQEFSTGDLSGQGGPTPPVSGHFDVREIFGELQVPLVEHNFIDELSLDGAYRHSVYHVGVNDFSTNTYKIEARFAPIRDVRFRASYNRAVRAPNIVELFFPTAIGLSGNVDPCAGAAVGGLTNGTDAGPKNGVGFNAAQCALTGVSAAQFGSIAPNPAAQYQALFGGNPNLKPEVADTWTAGVILQPRFIPGLAVTADYFNIHVSNLIGSLGFAQVINGCLGGDASLCGFIHRAPGTGSLWIGPNAFISLLNVNQAGLALETKGVDINGTYSHRLGGLGTLNLSLVGTYLAKLENVHTGVNCAGLYAGVCANVAGATIGPSPKWRHKARATLTLPSGIGASLAWRYFSGVDAEASQGAEGADAHIKAASYFDLALTARLQQRLNLRLGVNNMFDREPPIVGAPAANGNTFPQVYDSLGRYVYAGFTVDF